MNQKGFSLVEMMVAVAIVGVLTAIAIPNYEAYTARSRSAEAKAALSGIFTAEKNYLVESSSYTSCLAGIGYTDNNQTRYYEVGFASAGSTATLCDTNGGTDCSEVQGTACASTPNGSAPGAISSPTSVVGNAFAANSVSDHAAPFPVDGSFPPTGLSLAHFSAGAAGNISNSNTTYDTWTIQDNDTLINTQSGL